MSTDEMKRKTNGKDVVIREEGGKGRGRRGGVEEGRRGQERTKKERTQANSFYPQSNLVYLDLIPNPLNTLGLHPLRAPHLHTSGKGLY